MLTAAELKDAQDAIERELEYSEAKKLRIDALLKKEKSVGKRINRKALVAIHLTDFFPDHGILQTTGEVGLNIDGKKIYFPRETIHFSLNGPVGSHMYGSWEGKKYVILVPLNLIFERVYALRPEDTFIMGQLNLPKGSEIIGEEKNLTGKNPGNATLVPFLEGEDAHQAAKRRIKERGYVLAEIGMWSWSFRSEAEALQEIAPTLYHKPFYEMIEKEGKSSLTHQAHLFGEIEGHVKGAILILGGKHKIFSKSQLEDMVRVCKDLRIRLEEIIEKNKYKPMKSINEEQAFERILNLLKELPYEYELLKMKVSTIKKIDELSEEEKEWLLSEYHLLEKFKSKIEKDKFKSAKKILRRLSTRERRVYSVYQELKGMLESTKKNKNLIVDLDSIEEAMEVQQAILARGLSRGSKEMIGLINEGNVNQLELKIDKFEESIAAIEARLKALKEIIHRKINYSMQLAV
ncbi:hypothetical protein HOC13_01185 [Candidatus Woesearchaeota archaeon]|jgi:hypothetical protein|nr:hypothetical protein [Candidatus Woesearchaeota archaeon]